MAAGCKHYHEEKLVGTNGLLRLYLTYLLKIVNEKSYCAWHAQL